MDSEEVSIGGSSMSDTPPSSRYDFLGSYCSALEGRSSFPAHLLCTWSRIAMSSHKTMSSCSHSKKSPSLSHRDLQRHGAKGAGGAGKKEQSGFGSTPSWMNTSIKPGQFAGEHCSRAQSQGSDGAQNQQAGS
jgi:hypothetical protein